MLAIIGGTGLNVLDGFESAANKVVETRYAAEPVSVERGFFHGRELLFLPRHGKGHRRLPHTINYRANIDVLGQLGVTAILAVNAVGGIDARMGPGGLAIPGQLIDYTWGRAHTFAEDGEAPLHIDFTDPYDEQLRRVLADAAAEAGREAWFGGTYGCTQGPRLETAAEVRRLARDGCDMIGMTAMPEAALARERSIPYAALALSVNWAAGLSGEVITMEDIRGVLENGMQDVHAILEKTVKNYHSGASAG